MHILAARPCEYDYATGKAKATGKPVDADTLAYLQACRRTGRANESEDLGQLAEKTRGIIANSLARIEQATSR